MIETDMVNLCLSLDHVFWRTGCGRSREVKEIIEKISKTTLPYIKMKKGRPRSFFFALHFSVENIKKFLLFY
jgi:hypothetical protein